jgi:hypothetical protein
MFRLGVDAERQLGWLDFDADNQMEIIRDGDAAYFRASSFPGFEEQEGWIRVPVNPADPLNQVARLTSLGELSYTLLLPEAPTAPLFDEIRALQLSADGNEAPLDADDPESPVVRWAEDPGGNIAEISVEHQNADPLGEQGIRITPVASDGIDGVPRPADSETESLAEVPASSALLGSRLLDPACRDPQSPGDVEADRQCVREATAEMTVREWVQLHAIGSRPGISGPCA